MVASRPLRLSGADTTTSSMYVPLHTTTVAQAGAASTAAWMVEEVAVPHDVPALDGLPAGETKIVPLAAPADATTKPCATPAPTTSPAATNIRTVFGSFTSILPSAQSEMSHPSTSDTGWP